MKKIFFLLSMIVAGSCAYAQELPEEMNNSEKDSVYIAEVEKHLEPPKILHAEPLFIDLIRDLGARKGEKEWNIGFGIQDNLNYDTYSALVEYEWAPINRLGLEIEVPLTFTSTPGRMNGFEREGIGQYQRPGSRINGLKTAAQWTFLVSEKYKTSMALGYLNEIEMPAFREYGKYGIVNANVYNPFFVAAKRFGQNYHTLVYTGPIFEHHFKERSVHTIWQLNTNFHYMITGTRNFVGIEFNKEFHDGHMEMTIRPQMRVVLSETLMVGIVAGIPVHKEHQRFSSFVRLIYEPKHKH